MKHPGDPMVLFREAFASARASEPTDATAMALATASRDGRPSVRMVLLKDADERGFVFYTNRTSRKARELDDNPFASLVIHWAKAMLQVRVEGRVERVSDAESDAYFATRPRESQLGAWASQQSARLPDRSELDARVAQAQERFPGEVTRPPFWGGYRVVPERIEFWHGQLARLHDRYLYERSGGAWAMSMMYP